MVVNDNLLSISQTFFLPETVQKISDVIGQTTERTGAALKSVIPTLMKGIVDAGATPEGAAKLVDMINTHKFEYIARPDVSKIEDGHEAIRTIFGNKLTSIVSALQASTGLGTSQVEKLLDLAAPVFMGVLGSKVKYEKTSSLGLMHFLSDQKMAMSGFKNFVSASTKSFTLPNQAIPWRGVFLSALVLLGVYFWWLAANNIPSPQIATTFDGKTIAYLLKALPVRELDKFITEGTENELPKHFKFERLHFVSGEVGIARGSEAELDRVASVLKKNPVIHVRIEGFTDNIGPETRNRRLSQLRALAVKEQLVARGVESERIEVFGYGSANPLANNSFVHGRAVNNRVELVVTKLR